MVPVSKENMGSEPKWGIRKVPAHHLLLPASGGGGGVLYAFCVCGSPFCKVTSAGAQSSTPLPENKRGSHETVSYLCFLGTLCSLSLCARKRRSRHFDLFHQKR